MRLVIFGRKRRIAFFEGASSARPVTPGPLTLSLVALSSAKEDFSSGAFLSEFPDTLNGMCSPHPPPPSLGDVCIPLVCMISSIWLLLGIQGDLPDIHSILCCLGLRTQISLNVSGPFVSDLLLSCACFATCRSALLDASLVKLKRISDRVVLCCLRCVGTHLPPLYAADVQRTFSSSASGAAAAPGSTRQLIPCMHAKLVLKMLSRSLFLLVCRLSF